MRGYREVLDFWFAEGREEQWFGDDAAFDAAVRSGFGDVQRAAAVGRLAAWERAAESALALVIALDQFSRNMFRGSAKAFASDGQARATARRAVDRGFDMTVPQRQRPFFYLPFQHSEALADQELSVRLTRERIDDARTLDYAVRHHAVIERFGRFPHRNAVLGRESTDEELDFLKGRDEPF